MEGLALVLLYLAIPSLLFSAVQQILLWRKKTLGSVAKFPGPQQFPIVGRVHDLPRFSMWLKFKEWAGKMESFKKQRKEKPTESGGKERYRGKGINKFMRSSRNGSAP